MANTNDSLGQETFPDLVEKVRTEIREKFAKAHQLLLDREQHLLEQLQLWLDSYREQIRETNTLKEGQDLIEQNNSTSVRVKKELKSVPITYKSITLDWDELFENELRNIGKVVVDVTNKNIPNYRMMSQPVTTFGRLSRTNRSAGVFGSPKEMAIDPVTDNIYITDNNNCVQVFNQSFEFLFLFNTRMGCPTGICIVQDKVYVVQYTRNCLNVYSINGEFLRSVGRRGSNKLQFCGARSIDISIDRNRIYITEFQNKRVQCLNLDLTFHSFISDIKKPKCVKLTSNEILVLCLVIPYLQIYNCEHQLIRKAIWMQPELNPYRLCIDKVGNYVITDKCEDCVKVFSRSGELIHQIGERGTNTGQFIKPRGILISREGRIIVVSENPNNVLQMF